MPITLLMTYSVSPPDQILQAGCGNQGFRIRGLYVGFRVWGFRNLGSECASLFKSGGDQDSRSVGSAAEGLKPLQDAFKVEAHKMSSHLEEE